MITIENLLFYYQQNSFSLSIDKLTINKGEAVALLGPNGAGKTTLIRCILGILKDVRGNILLDGKPAIGCHEFRKIGYMPENCGLYPFYNLHEYIDYFCALRKYVNKNNIEKIAELLSLNIHDKKKLAHYSKGMKKKVQLLVSVFHNPEILIMDEPIDGIDMSTKLEIINYINSLKSDGKTIIISTHDPHLIEKTSDKLVILHKGKKLLMILWMSLLIIIQKQKRIF